MGNFLLLFSNPQAYIHTQTYDFRKSQNIRLHLHSLAKHLQTSRALEYKRRRKKIKYRPPTTIQKCHSLRRFHEKLYTRRPEKKCQKHTKIKCNTRKTTTTLKKTFRKPKLNQSKTLTHTSMQA